MCGIVGELRFQGKSVNTAIIEKMRDRLVHRGPDDKGLFVDKQIGLGFRRLAILDLTAAGHQPMQSDDREITIVFNGEIYNFKERKKELEQKGYFFKSQSDTEVIIALYKEYGMEFMKYLRGMFAIAIWDSKRQRLILVRDRLGKKPLKFYRDNHGIIFASELKAILEHPRVQKKIDPIAIHHYLTLQYVPAPLTGFIGIEKLPAGHFVVIENDKMIIKRYWDLKFITNNQLTEDEWTEKILNELRTVVRMRLISDVPLGAFLSGGIDSSAIVALMAEYSNQPVKTFSIGFEEDRYNELPYARQIAKLYNTDHTEFIVKPQNVDILPQIAWQYEEPYADSSALPTFLLAQLTRQHVTVALNGDGGDENFGGYERYPIYMLASRLSKWPSLIRPLMNAIARAARGIYPTDFTNRSARFSSTLASPPARRYLEYLQYFSDEYKTTNYTSDFREQTNNIGPTWNTFSLLMDNTYTNEPINQALYTDIKTYLPDDLLVKVDIASMAWSLEGRSPLLDHVFMELTATIPATLKVRGWQKKYIFRKALKNIVPDNILNRPKRGFSIPIDKWFRGELNQLIENHLEKFSKRRILKPEAIKMLLHRHQTGRVSYAHQLWSLLMLELWMQQYEL